MARITTTGLALAMTITAAGGAAAAEFSVLTYNVRGLPPLVIERGLVDDGLAILEKALATA